MSNGTVYLICFLAVTIIGPLMIFLRNRSFDNRAESVYAEKETQEFAREVMDEGENLILSDYSSTIQMHAVFTDQGIYTRRCKGSKDVRFSVRYDEISQCDFLDYGSGKVKSTGNVMHIRLYKGYDKCMLSYFPKIREMAAELAKRGFEKKSLF